MTTNIENELKQVDKVAFGYAGAVVTIGAVLMLLVTNGTIGDKLVAAVLGAALLFVSFYGLGVGGLRQLLKQMPDADLGKLDKNSPERRKAGMDALSAFVALAVVLILIMAVSALLFWHQLGGWTLILPIVGMIAGIIGYLKAAKLV